MSQALILDPKKQKFLEYWFNSKNNKTFGNVYFSALAAGYSENYAKQLSSVKTIKWLTEFNALTKLEPEHIIQGIQNFALDGRVKHETRLRAYELLAKILKMMSDTGNINLTQVNVSVSEEKAKELSEGFADYLKNQTKTVTASVQ